MNNAKLVNDIWWPDIWWTLLIFRKVNFKNGTVWLDINDLIWNIPAFLMTVVLSINSFFNCTVRIWIAKFCFFVIQMVYYSDAITMVRGILIANWYSNGGLNTGLFTGRWYGTWHLNSKPFDDWTNSHDLNTKLVCNSDQHCAPIMVHSTFDLQPNGTCIE